MAGGASSAVTRSMFGHFQTGAAAGREFALPPSLSLNGHND